MNNLSGTKNQLHTRNRHRNPYDFDALIRVNPELKTFVTINKYGNPSIDFFNANAIIALNKALLKFYYQVNYWHIPQNSLCPPIPGRADYIHYLADVLAAENGGEIPTGKKINGVDIGTGAGCIYPLLGHAEYGWKFVATDILKSTLEAATAIKQQNSTFSSSIEFRLQQNKKLIFNGIFNKMDRYDFSMCNPPFHSSAKEAMQSSIRKNSHLKKQVQKKAALNFGGMANELWYPGGEYTFIHQMIKESTQFNKNVLWFTTLVSKSSNINHFTNALKNTKATEVKIIEMKQGQKTSRIICWTYYTLQERKLWANIRWQ